MKRKEMIVEEKDLSKARKSSKWHLLFNRAQRAWADWMQKKTSNMSQGTLVVLLFLFISCSIVYNALILSGYLVSSDIDYGRVSEPAKLYFLEDSSKVVSVQEELGQISKFRKYMDSLSSTEEGRVIYDSIMSVRPGLLDSVRHIENILGNQ